MQRTLPHAASAMGANNAYTYDCNGNQTRRDIGNDTYDLSYDPEGHLLLVEKNDTTIATFVYDGDGRRVKSTMGGTTIVFVGNHYEVSGGTVTKYYYANALGVAMRKGTSMYYLLGDHLGSTSIVTNGVGTVVSENRYKAWGEVRYTSGTTPTKYTYTGQYTYTSDFGLMYYNARWYDPALGRFAQADTVVPGGVQGYDRYAYVNNSPLNATDPSGNYPASACNDVPKNQQQTCLAGADAGADSDPPEDPDPPIVDKHDDPPPCTFNNNGGWQCSITLSVEDYNEWMDTLKTGKINIILIYALMGGLLGGIAGASFGVSVPLAILGAIAGTVVGALAAPEVSDFDAVMNELFTGNRDQNLGANGSLTMMVFRNDANSPLYIMTNPGAVPTEINSAGVIEQIIGLVNAQVGQQIPLNSY